MCHFRGGIFQRRARCGTVHQIASVLSGISYSHLEMNVYDISFVSLVYLKPNNNLEYLLCSLYLRIKILTNVLFHVTEWRCTFLTWKQYGPGSFVPVKLKEEKDGSFDLSAKYISRGFWRNLSFIEMHLTDKIFRKYRVQTTPPVVLLEKKEQEGFIIVGYTSMECLIWKTACIKNNCVAPYIPAMKIVKKISLDLSVRILQILTKCDISINALPV